MSDKQQIIDTAKKNGHRVFSAKVAGTDCIYRSITRKEFRDIQRKMADKTEAIRKSGSENNDTQLSLLKEEGEEEIFLRAVLLPKVASQLDLAVLPAGIVPSLSELIMEASGFGETAVPQEL